MKHIFIKAPFDDATVDGLRAGDSVRLSGIIYTARDAAHRRLIQALDQNTALPLPLAGSVIYYVGPAPAKPGHVLGPAGPTTSGRMDPYTEPLLRLGVKGLIGKGYRSPPVKAALVKHHAVYLAAIGGAAALLSRHVRSSQFVAYEELGTEAIRELIVSDFPLIVVNDCYGGDAYVSGRTRYSRQNRDHGKSENV
jgi:fumarate hydratase subunit beta